MANYSKEFDLICLPLQKKYRSQIEIIALILEVAGSNGAALYSLMKRTGINYAQLKKYLPSLAKIGFLEAEVREGKISFRVSERGFAFLRQYNVLRDMLLSTYVDNKTVNAVQEENNLAKVEPRATLPLSLRSIRRR
ncbi:MAG: winged helix-turn-helix domain-containing protein [Candidatus Bathyarchaeota archaeon]|nr:winged helix-turn-helix domain-containing protein [Candidatus Bathyarchaeota archaeon]